MRTLKKALAWAEGQRQNPTQNWSGLCQKFARSCWDINPGYPSAIAAWNAQAAKYKHSDRNVPPGALVYFSGGQYGHATFSAGGTKIYSTDILRRGKVDLVDISTIEKKWGLRYLGWTDHQGKIVLPVGTPPKVSTSTGVAPAPKPKPPAPAPAPTPSQSTFPLPSTHAFGPKPSTTVHNGTKNAKDKAAVQKVQKKFKGLPVTGVYGSQTTAKVRAWQIKRLLPPTGRVGKREWDRLGL